LAQGGRGYASSGVASSWRVLSAVGVALFVITTAAELQSRSLDSVRSVAGPAERARAKLAAGDNNNRQTRAGRAPAVRTPMLGALDYVYIR